MTLSTRKENALSDGLPISLEMRDLLLRYNLPTNQRDALDKDLQDELTYGFFMSERYLWNPSGIGMKEKLEELLSNLWK